jgi:hypothetical protein
MVTAIDYGNIAPTTVYYMVGSSTANQWSQVFVSRGLLRLRFFFCVVIDGFRSASLGTVVCDTCPRQRVH